jgi:hypothetical protein
MYLSYTQMKDMIPNIIKGKILVQETNQALANAHIQIMYGQEEVITNSNGEFVLRSWQAFPLTLVVEHKQYDTNCISIQKPLSSYIILLKPKPEL